jgi:hypothetical protein
LKDAPPYDGASGSSTHDGKENDFITPAVKKFQFCWQMSGYNRGV